VVQGLPMDSDCAKAMQASLVDGVFISDPRALFLEAKTSCLDVASKIETIWLQIDYLEDNPIKSIKGEIDVDGAELVNQMKGKGEKPSFDHIDSAHFDMQGLSKATMWVDVSQEFMKSLKIEITFDVAIARKMTTPGELRDVAASSLFHAKLLTSDLLFSFAPGSAVPSSVVQRRLSSPVRSFPPDLTPEVVPSAAQACFYEMSEELIDETNAKIQANAAGYGFDKPVRMISNEFTIGGLSPQSLCCTTLKGFKKTWDWSPDEDEELRKACMPEVQKVKGVWAKAAFTPSEDQPLTGASGFAMVDGAMIDKMIKDFNHPAITMIDNMIPNQILDGFERLYLGISYSRAEAGVVLKDFSLTKAGLVFTFDEAMSKALAKKQGGGVFEGHGHMEKVLWQLVSQAPHAAAMIGMAAAAPLAKTEVASQFTVGAVSLVGSLALLAAVAGALTTRSRRQARSVQNVGSVESATELTTQEVA